MTDGTVHSRKGPQNFSFYLCGGLNVIAGHLLLFFISVWEKKSSHTHPQMKAQYKAASQQNWKVSTNWENCWFQLLKAHTSCLSRVLIWFILQQINLAMQGSGLAAVSQWPMTLVQPAWEITHSKKPGQHNVEQSQPALSRVPRFHLPYV